MIFWNQGKTSSMSGESLIRMLLSLLCAFFFTECAREIRPVKIPIDTVFYENPSCSGCGKLFVFLPGKDDTPSSFDRGGFIDAVLSRNVPFDMLVVDAHLGYYLKGNILERLKKDVIRPEQERGYNEIWFVSISLGAIGSLGYIDTHPGDNIAGVVLLGPYLGDASIADEIIAADGLQNWEPGDVKDKDWQRKLWLFLKIYTMKQPPKPKLILAYGERDRFAMGAKLLAAWLPRERVFTNSGHHTWPAWRSLWEEILDKDFRSPNND